MKDKLTVKEQARLTNMSERNVYKLRAVQLLRPDIADAYGRGELSLHQAWLKAEGREAPTTRDRLLSAWHAASNADKAELVAMIWDQIEGEEV